MGFNCFARVHRTMFSIVYVVLLCVFQHDVVNSTGSPFYSVHTTNSLRCEKICAYHTDCKSFRYKYAIDMCELYLDTSACTNFDFSQAPGNPCMGKPCQTGEICVLTEMTSFGYRCLKMAGARTTEPTSLTTHLGSTTTTEIITQTTASTPAARTTESTSPTAHLASTMPTEIITQTTASTPDCQSGWVLRPSTQDCYFFSSDEATWWQAESKCKTSHSALLVKVPDEDTNKYLTNTKDNGEYWIGLYDVSAEGIFLWKSDETPLVTSSWAQVTGNSHNKDCVKLKDNGNWHAEKCSDKLLRYICRKSLVSL